jgi:hypothetical protein
MRSVSTVAIIFKLLPSIHLRLQVISSILADASERHVKHKRAILESSEGSWDIETGRP